MGRQQQDARGNTRVAGPDQARLHATADSGHALRQPNEHDESADSQGRGTAGNTAVGQQAHRDATSGQQDTDRGPVTDKVYQETLRDDGAKSAQP